MARPRMGIFGMLAVVGGVLAWRWAQRQRVTQVHLNRELNRWEDEGGSVVAPAQAAPGASVTPAGAGGATRTGETNGAAHPNGMGEAWPFPRS
jgi:hypothetical protein